MIDTAKLPPVKGISKLNASDAYTGDIIDAIHHAFSVAVDQVKYLAPQFKRNTHLSTARFVWDFLKIRIRYQKDTEYNQLIKMPNVFVKDGTGDCKSYSLFAAAIMAANGYPVTFRYAGYTPGSNALTHVYIVSDGIIIDGVYSKFNEQKPPAYYKDYKMNVYTLSGIGAAEPTPVTKLVKFLGQLKHQDGIVASLVRKEIARLTNQRVQGGRILSDEQLGEYKNTLQRIMQRNANRTVQLLAAAEIERINNRSHDHIIAGIGKIKLKKVFKKAGKVLKKVSLSPARSAFLTMVNFNVHHFASSLKKKIESDPGKVKSLWEKLGGNFSKLQGAVNNGAGKKPILGINGIGIAPAALAASAAPIIVAFGALLKAIGGAQDAKKKEQLKKALVSQGVPEAMAEAQAAAALEQDKNLFDKVNDGITKAQSLVTETLDPDGIEVTDKDTSFNFDKRMIIPLALGGVLLVTVISKNNK